MSALEQQKEKLVVDGIRAAAELATETAHALSRAADDPQWRRSGIGMARQHLAALAESLDAVEALLPDEKPADVQ